jgi:ribosomal protein S18 acetylase RimI-like enzyme
MASTRPGRVVVRPLEGDELDAMREVWKASGLPNRPRGRDSLPNLRQQWKRNPGYFLGAFRGDRMVGVSIFTDDGRKGWINRLAVVPDEQRKGIAAKLVGRSRSIMKRKGLLLMCALIETDNERSIRLFEKLGFKVETSIAYLTLRERESF